MSRDVHVVTNANYQNEAAYPDAAKRLREVENIAAQARMGVHRIWLQFRPDQDTNALDSIVEQTRASFREIEPGANVVTLMGDGGTGTWLRAKQILDQDQSVRRNDRVFVGTGGTMNLIAQALRVKLEHLQAFLAGDQSFQEVITREIIIHKLKGGLVHIPWVAFAGVGFDGRFLERYDGMSRTNHVLVNVLLTALGLAPSVLSSDEYFTWDMALAVSQLGLIKFPPEEFDRLGSRDFNRVQLGPETGRGVAVKGIALQFTGFHPAISRFYWREPDLASLLDILPGHANFRKIIESVRPSVSNGDHQPHQIDGEFTFHADGFPHRLRGGASHYEFVSRPEAGVKVYSPRRNSVII